MKRLIFLIICMAVLSGCSNNSEINLSPLMGLEWFSSYDDIKNELSDFKLIEEREKTDSDIVQKMQDYEGLSLFGADCDLTLCFTESGLIGFNYHDIYRNRNYREWFMEIEKEYGYPTEESSGMASWYENPLGKNTAIYLFNLEEGVQVSFYATADSPDKSYSGKISVPSPEIRTPIVSADSENTSATTETSGEITETNTTVSTLVSAEKVTGAYRAENESNTETNDIISDENTTSADIVTYSVSTSESTNTSSATTTSMTVSQVTTEIIDNSGDEISPIDSLEFYSSPDSERQKMSGYSQLYEYRTEESGQPWELIMEYENVPYMDKNCNTILCFTSLGLVGINYFDSDKSSYDFWINQLTDVYGSPDDIQNDYCLWSNAVGNDIVLYIFSLDDGVQISFFADDTGSE